MIQYLFIQYLSVSKNAVKSCKTNAGTHSALLFSSVTTFRSVWPYFPKVTKTHLFLVIEFIIYDILSPAESYQKEVSFRMVSLFRPSFQRHQSVADVAITASKIHLHEGNYDKQSRQQNNI